MQRHEVRARQQLVERRRARPRAARSASGCGERAVYSSVTSKPRSSSATRVPMRPRPTMPTTLPHSSRPSSCAGLPAGPAAGAHQALRLAQPPCRRQHQRHRQLGGRVREHVGGVRDDHAALAARLDVDVVVADREVRDHPQRPARPRPAAPRRPARSGRRPARPRRRPSSSSRGRPRRRPRRPRSARPARARPASGR